jgi:hypothetical protein
MPKTAPKTAFKTSQKSQQNLTPWEKTQRTRSRKRKQAVQRLFSLIQSNPGQTDYDYACQIERHETFVRHELATNKIFLPLIRAGMIAVLAHSPRKAKWVALAGDTPLPVLKSRTHGTAMAMIPKTGNAAFNADISALQSLTVKSLRRSCSARQYAKQKATVEMLLSRTTVGFSQLEQQVEHVLGNMNAMMQRIENLFGQSTHTLTSPRLADETIAEKV